VSLSIDRLSVRLPEGFAGRAEAIVRLMAAELPELVGPGSAARESVRVPPVTMHPGHPDAVVAHAIAAALAAEIGRQR
jgi:hypothetical protein